MGKQDNKLTAALAATGTGVTAVVVALVAIGAGSDRFGLVVAAVGCCAVLAAMWLAWAADPNHEADA